MIRTIPRYLSNPAQVRTRYTATKSLMLLSILLLSLTSLYGVYTYDLNQRQDAVYFDVWLRLSIYCGMTSEHDVPTCDRWGRETLERRGIILGFNQCMGVSSVLSETFAGCVREYEIKHP